MIYKKYGSTGVDVSAVGMGCMRVTQGGNNDMEACAKIIRYAYDKGINYFDTAPAYCDGRNEEMIGMALHGLERDSYYVSTKTNFTQVDRPATEKGFFDRLENSLTRLKVDYIDFYHLWCMLSLKSYRKQCDTLYGWFLKAKEMGMIKHICVSSHMDGADVATMLDEGLFEGVLLGYNALNFRFRLDGIRAAHKNGMGVAVMNPLGGGIIPKCSEHFTHLTRGTDYTVAQAALRFVAAHEEISTTLVGFSSEAQVDEAILAIEGLDIRPVDEIIARIDSGEGGINNLCTGCGYCDQCPEGIQIPKFMDVYNFKYLVGSIGQRMGMHWAVTPEEARKCTGCGKCEALCTQHLPIRERLKELGSVAK